MRGEHKAKTLALLRRGWVTALECAKAGGCLSLSQRVSELRADGAIVVDKWVALPSGARIKAYRMLLPSKWTA